MNKAFEKILERFDAKKQYFQKFYEKVGKTEEDEYINKATQLAFDDAKQIVWEVAEEYNVGWIACSERLPKEDGSYLVQSFFEEEVHFYDQYYDSGCEAFGTYRDYYDENTLGFLDSEFVKDEYVIAWQPLPEPFKERES